MRYFCQFIILIGTICITLQLRSQTMCEGLFDTYTDILNQRLSSKYSDLNAIVKNPSDFIENIRQRFELKKSQGQDPFSFNYYDISQSALYFAKKTLETKIYNLQSEIYGKNQDYLNLGSTSFLFKYRKIRSDVSKLTAHLNYLNELYNETNTFIDKREITYKRSVEFFYYFSRAIGHNEAKSFSFLDKSMLSVDRYFQGYIELTIFDEYLMYKENKFELFQTHSGANGFKVSQGSFEKSFSNADRIETIVVPLSRSIDRDILFRLMPFEINLIGLVDKPFKADGFVRPSGDFWMHDLRHESAKIHQISMLKLSRKLDDSEWKRFQSLQDKWIFELFTEMARCNDPNLKEALDLIAFNFHHDRGYPFVPSLWLKRNVDYVPLGLLIALNLSGQGAGYNKQLKTSRQALEWLNNFWKSKAPEEDNFFNTL